VMAPLTTTLTETWMILNWSPADDVLDLMARLIRISEPGDGRLTSWSSANRLTGSRLSDGRAFALAWIGWDMSPFACSWT
jgi:hypothetical protein